LTFLFAGHDTTTNLLVWAVYYLSQNLDVQQKAEEEVDEVLNGQFPNSENLVKLKYLKCIVKETLRLKPSAPMRGRTLIENDTICGYHFKKGQSVSWNNYAVHHDPVLWPDPEKFLPNRFLTTDIKHPFAYFPFGGGPRKCIGEHFAMNEALVVLSMLVSKFRFKVLEGHLVDDVIALTLKTKYGMKMHIMKRSTDIPNLKRFNTM